MFVIYMKEKVGIRGAQNSGRLKDLNKGQRNAFQKIDFNTPKIVIFFGGGGLGNLVVLLYLRISVPNMKSLEPTRQSGVK